MAQTVKILITDDLDGSEGAETVRFGLDGKMYEIDLSEENAAKLREAVTPFAEKARKVTAKQGELFKAPKAKKTSTGKGPDPEIPLIRKWAQENGHKVGDKGRIPIEIKNAYYDAVQADEK